MLSLTSSSVAATCTVTGPSGASTGSDTRRNGPSSSTRPSTVASASSSPVGASAIGGRSPAVRLAASTCPSASTTWASVSSSPQTGERRRSCHRPRCSAAMASASSTRRLVDRLGEHAALGDDQADAGDGEHERADQRRQRGDAEANRPDRRAAAESPSRRHRASEPVAGAAHGLDRRRAERLVDLAAQAADVDLDDVGVAVEVHRPRRRPGCRPSTGPGPRVGRGTRARRTRGP